MPDNQIQRLLRILTRSNKQCHTTPILKKLHWLPVRYRIIFKILVLTYQAYHGVAPDYLCELISKHHGIKSL